MIAFVEGSVAERQAGRAVILAGGVGYELLVSATTLTALPPVGEQARILTHLHVRDDAMTLYGFASAPERDLFLALVGVNGIGPKMALAVLSSLSPEALRRAVLDGDVDSLTVVPGVGRKVAARVVLDLRDRLGGETELPQEGALSEVRDALAGLGLTPIEVRDALAGIEADGESVEVLLRRALQRVGAPT